MLTYHIPLAAAALSLVRPAFSAAPCSTSTVMAEVPAATPVALKEYSYCGGTLETKVYIKNVNYNKIVKIYYSDASGKATPLSVVQLGYQSSIDNTDYEYWGASTGYVNYDGIDQLLNITYQALDIGETYVQPLNLDVKASGPKPTTSTIPAPYATPTGFSQDITDWLAPKQGSQAARAKRLMFANIEVTDSANGSIAAAQSYDNPNYGYHWVRDSSLTMDVVATFYASATNKMQTTYEDLFFRYAKRRAAEQNDPDLKTGLGEPKFNLDGTVFTGPWGRPQNDGPATAAITLIEFSNAYLAKGGSKSTIKKLIYDTSRFPNQAPLKKDLLFVASNWTSSSFDLWEEENSDHFYTRLVQHRAMVIGAKFATSMGDDSTAGKLRRQGAAIAATLPQFWDKRRNLILYEYGPVLANKYSYKDVAVVLGVIHGYANDGLYSFSNDQILATTLQIVTSFIPIYDIAKKHKDSTGKILGTPVGRYPEDIYDGVATSRGNAWYLCTASVAELFYRATQEFKDSGSIKVTAASRDFWKYFAPQVDTSVGKTYRTSSKEYSEMISSLVGWGDAFLRTVKFYTPAGGHMSEEIDRDSGKAVGAIDLTWSYASLLTAAFARAEVTGEKGYLTRLSNIVVQTNSTLT